MVKNNKFMIRNNRIMVKNNRVINNKINNNKDIKYKQKNVYDYVKTKYFAYKILYDKTLDVNTNSLYRPDIQISFNDFIIMIEIDENQHSQYDEQKEKEKERLNTIANECNNNGKQLAVIKFNPDSYIVGNEQISSSWTRDNVLSEDLQQYQNWYNRLLLLEHCINDYIINPPSENKITHLFYNKIYE